MRKVTMNEYIELIDELCAKCDSGELTEEGVNDILVSTVEQLGNKSYIMEV